MLKNINHSNPHQVEQDAVHTLQITNIAATFFIGTPINLKEIIIKNPLLIDYNARFEAGIIHFLVPHKCACIIFSPGEVLVVGAKRKTNVVLAAWKCCLTLRKCGVLLANVTNLTIQNVSYATNYGHPIDIVEFYKKDLLAQYTPENFSSAIAIKEPTLSVTVNAFYTGRIIITGIEFEKEAIDAYLKNLIKFDAFKFIGTIEELKEKIKYVESNGIQRENI